MAEKKELIIPSMGESLTEGTLVRWLKPEGSFVNQDEAVAELETDKITLEILAPLSGVVSETLKAPGDIVEVGAIIGYITSGEAPAVVAQAPEPPLKESGYTASSAPAPFPSAQKLMTERGLTPQDLQGTGKGGRITKGDVLLRPQPSLPSPDPKEQRVKMSRLRQRVAERLKEAQQTAAILTTFNEVDMSRIQHLRETFKVSFEKKHGVKLGFMSFFVQACVAALKEFPVVNAEIQEDEIVFKNYYDIGVAVGTPQGLVVPIIRGAENLTFAAIEKTLGDLSQKARDGKLALQDLTGGTFTISNGGVYGSLLSTPILNPPQSGILGMHKIENRPIAVGETVVVRPMMYIALSYDHRLIDGREAVTFLVRIKEQLENPERMLLEC